MPWGWDKRGDADVIHGGSRGTPDETKVAHAWPKYEAEYLKNALNTRSGKYAYANPSKEVKDYIYFDKITEDYKQEADENLRMEFADWLQGKHADNMNPQHYANGDGNPARLAIYEAGSTDEEGVVKPKVPQAWVNDEGDVQPWQATWWGKKQLTHLPGVREYLRENFKNSTENNFKMNILAEHGPQNIEDAWMYFKHWVKRRPTSHSVPMHVSHGEIGRKSDFGRQPPAPFLRRPDSTAGPSGPSSSTAGLDEEMDEVEEVESGYVDPEYADLADAINNLPARIAAAMRGGGSTTSAAPTSGMEALLQRLSEQIGRMPGPATATDTSGIEALLQRLSEQISSGSSTTPSLDTSGLADMLTEWNKNFAKTVKYSIDSMEHSINSNFLASFNKQTEMQKALAETQAQNKIYTDRRDTIEAELARAQNQQNEDQV